MVIGQHRSTEPNYITKEQTNDNAVRKVTRVL